MMRIAMIMIGMSVFGTAAVNVVRAEDAPQVAVAAVEVDPALDAVLRRLEKSGEELAGLRAEVEYTVTQAIKEDEDDLDEVQTFTGWVKLQRRPESRFNIHLKSWTDGRVIVDDDPKWFILEGTWLSEVRTKEQRVVRTQLVEDGKTVEPFRLGEGLFPLPFGQSREDMLAEFDLELLGSAADGTDHLAGSPRPVSKLSDRYSRIEMFISRKPKTMGLPVRVVLHDFKDHTIKAVQFNRIKLNPGLKASDFKLPSRAQKWERVEKRLGEGH